MARPPITAKGPLRWKQLSASLDWLEANASGGISDGDKGDVTVSASGATWTIDAGAVTLSKMANLAASTILGNNTGAPATPIALTAAQVRTLINVADGATANASNADLRDRSTHTGTQLAATISDFATAVAATAAVTANTAKVSNATHTGDVTGSTALTIANDAVTYAKMQNAPSAGFIGATGAGDYAHRTPTEVTAALDVFTTALKGLAPSSGGGTANYLRADGTWAAPPGTGGTFALNDATDATISGAVQGQTVTHDGTDFKNLTRYTFTVGPFFINDVPGTATTQATLAYFNTATALSRDADDMKMQTAGRIVGIIMTSDVARTAGTATARVRIAGAGAAFNGGSVVLDATNTLSDSDFVAWSSGNAFTAGQLIGAEVVTSGWTPTTANIAIWLVVAMQF